MTTIVHNWTQNTNLWRSSGDSLVTFPLFLSLKVQLTVSERCSLQSTNGVWQERWKKQARRLLFKVLLLLQDEKTFRIQINVMLLKSENAAEEKKVLKTSSLRGIATWNKIVYLFNQEIFNWNEKICLVEMSWPPAAEQKNHSRIWNAFISLFPLDNNIILCVNLWLIIFKCNIFPK